MITRPSRTLLPRPWCPRAPGPPRRSRRPARRRAPRRAPRRRHPRARPGPARPPPHLQPRPRPPRPRRRDDLPPARPPPRRGSAPRRPRDRPLRRSRRAPRGPPPRPGLPRLHDQLPPAQKPGLEADARSFEAFLASTCARESPDAACLARFHAAKREDLRRWLLPEAREEADRDPADAEALDRRLAARGIPAEPPARRREAIAALQRAAGLPPSGFLDARTAAAAEPPRPAPVPAPAPGLPAGAFWSPALPALLQESYALTTCAEPTLTWLGRGLLLGGQPLPGEAGYEIYGHEGPQGDQVFLVPRGGTPRIVEVRRDGTLRLSGTIPPALAERGVTPETALRRCEAAPAPVPPPARTRPGGESRAPAPRAAPPRRAPPSARGGKGPSNRAKPPPPRARPAR